MTRILLLASLICLLYEASSQIEYTQKSLDLLPTQLYGGVAMARADIDGDMHDDIVVTESGKYLSVYCYRGSNTNYEKTFTTNISSTWSLSIGDVTGNGLPDIIAVNSNNIILVEQISRLEFESTLIYSPEWLPQSSNLVDIENDGDLDLFVCNDEGKSIFLTNNGTGDFVENEIIDFTTEPQSDNSGNYSSIWTDIDGDGDKDLYIAKCRAGVTSFTDPRRINTLFLNNGDGTFTESANSFGLDDAYQSWSVDSGDVDNDGDFDILVTNHDGPHHLYINQGTSFEKFDYGEPINSFAFQGVFEDMDNNGWLDLVITDGQHNYILYNNEMEFTREVYQTAGAKPNTAIVLDINNDGFKDVLGAYPGGRFVGSSSNISNDKIWVNNGNDNSFINIRLVGKLSEGAIVELRGNFGTLTRELKNGTSYGQHIGSSVHFGLGIAPQIESMVVTRSDGTIQTIDGALLQSNNTFVLTEESCMTRIEEIELEDQNPLLCEGSTINIFSEMNNPVQWQSTQMQSQNWVVTTPGIYNYTYIDSNGCEHYSDYFNPISEDQYYTNILGLDQDLVISICTGDQYELTAIDANSYLWNTNDTTRTLNVTESGIYSVEIETSCGNIISSPSVDVVRSDIPEQILTGDIVDLGSEAFLTADQDSTYWYDTFSDHQILAIGKLFETVPLFESRYFYAQVENKNFLSSDNIGIPGGPDTLAYSGDHINSGLVFEVYYPIILNSVRVETDLPGKRKIVIRKGDEEVFSKTFEIGTGVNMLILGARLDEGSYVMTTDVETNMAELGVQGPRLTRVQDIETVSYPYLLGDDLAINNSLNGSSRYYYFFDWNVDYNYHECIGIRDSIYVEVRPLATLDKIDRLVSISPNPASNHVDVNIDGISIAAINIYSLQGKLLNSEKNINSEYFSFDLSGLASGVYVLEVEDKTGILHRDIILLAK